MPLRVSLRAPGTREFPTPPDPVARAVHAPSDLGLRGLVAAKVERPVSVSVSAEVLPTQTGALKAMAGRGNGSAGSRRVALRL